jgi:membrane protein DedA with SNARE-associated domain
MDHEDFLQYLGVFTALVAAAFGAPIPEELPIATGGVLVGRDWNVEGGLKWWIMLPLCILGVVLCDVILYVIGRKGGRWLLRRKWVQKRVLTPERFLKIEQNFEKYGIRILLIARLMPGIRTPVFISAGIVRLPFHRFLLADAIYAIPGVNLIFWLAYWFSGTFMNLLHRLESYRELAVIAVMSFIAGFITATFVRRPVSTGSPDELPVIGKPVATIGHPHGVHIPHDVPVPVPVVVNPPFVPAPGEPLTKLEFPPDPPVEANGATAPATAENKVG